MGTKPALLRRWYGPDTSESLDAASMGVRTTFLHSGIISVTDAQEAIALACAIFVDNSRSAAPGSTVVVRSSSGAGTIRYGAEATDLAAAEWESISFDVGFASEVTASPDEWNKWHFRDSLSLGFSVHGASLSSAEMGTPTGLPGGGELIAPRAHEAALKALEGGLKRRTPPIRRAQIRAAVFPLLVLALWLWAMLTWAPPLAVWLFTAALAGFVARASFTAVVIPPRHPVMGLQEAFGVSLIDLTPRAEVLARRASGHRDAKVVAVTVTATLAAAVITAYFTGLWTPGAGG